MSSAAQTTPAGAQQPRRGSLLARSAGLRTTLLLLPPMLWLGVAYLAALAALFITSLWTQNDFTGDIERVWSFDNYRQLWDIPVYRTIAFRSIGIACHPWGTSPLTEPAVTRTYGDPVGWIWITGCSRSGVRALTPVQLRAASITINPRIVLCTQWFS